MLHKIKNSEPDICAGDYVYLCMEALDPEELLDAMTRLRAFLVATGWTDLAKRVESVEKVIKTAAPENDEVVHDMTCCWLSNLQRKLVRDLIGDET